MSTYSIGEVAERSGFSASSLRYYDGIGLVQPASRTEAGYRLYDDHTINRLAFIARAKQLGCTLDEITDLAGIWDGERCGRVQRGFHDLVSAKIRDAERQIDDLTALLADLRAAAEHLAGEPVDAPCDADCACLTIASIPHANMTMDPLPIYDATAPIACTIGTDDIPERIELVERMRSNVRNVERTADGLLLRFAATAANEADVRRFANDETRCCQFWGFAVDTDDDELTLRWDGPPAAVEIVDRLHRYLTGAEPVDALTGLL